MDVSDGVECSVEAKMSPSISRHRTAALGLAAALIAGHENCLPPHPDRSALQDSLETGPTNVPLNAERREVARYIADATAKLPDSAALKSLVQVGSPAISTLERIASDPRSSLTVRTATIRAIGEIGGAESFSSLTRILSATRFDPMSGPLFRATIEAISYTGEHRGIAVLADILEGRNYVAFDQGGLNRVSAVWALGRFNSREAFEALWSVGANPNHSEEVREIAFSCVRRFGDLYSESQQRLLNLLESPGELSRADLLGKAAQFGLSEFAPELVSIALNDSYSVPERRSALNGLRSLKASEACRHVMSLLGCADTDISAATMKLLVSVGEPACFPEVIQQLRDDPALLRFFPRQEYVSRAVEDIDFLCATHESLWPVVQHAIFQCERPDLSIIEAADLSPLLAVAISGLTHRVLTQEITLAAQLGTPLTFHDQEIVESFMKLIVKYPVVAPSWVVPNLTLIAGVCPEPFLPYVGNPALPDHINAAIAGAIVRSGNAEAIRQLDPSLTKAFQEVFTLRLSGVLPIDGEPSPLFVPNSSSDLLKAVDRILEDSKEISLSSIRLAEDGSRSIDDRLTSIGMIRHLESSELGTALRILSSPTEAVRTRMATRILMIASSKHIPLELEARAAETLSPLMARLCAGNNNTVFFERIDSRVWDDVVTAATYAYTPRFCVQLLALANNEASGDRQEILGLLNRKVEREAGHLKFLDCLAQASADPSLSERDRTLAKRYYDALVGARQIGMRSPFRFSIELIERMVDDTQLRVDDNRPIVVISFAKADYNQASVFFRGQLEEMAQRGFRLLFMEPGDEEELVRQAGGLHSLMTASGIQGASAIFVFGHGSKTRISLGEKSSDEAYAIDPSDRGELSAFGALLKPGGVVAHLSCENGRGGKGSGNMVEFHREDVFPHAGVEKIIAPRTPTTLSGVRVIYKDGEIVDVIFPVESFKG